MSLERLQLDHFTAFRYLDLRLGAGLNVFIGQNGTGKTHIMKTLYASCDISKTGVLFSEKIGRVFLPSGMKLGRLVHRQRGSSSCKVEISRGRSQLKLSFSNHAIEPSAAKVTGAKAWIAAPIESVFIPAKEILSNGPGFRSLYAQREIHFEEIYPDLIDRAYRPPLKGNIDAERARLLEMLRKEMEGKVLLKNEEFFLRNRQGNLEFSLLAEGVRKLGLLWLLVQNGTLLSGSALFVDEPEANMNPRIMGVLVEMLLELQRLGVQVFAATHDYVFLKEIDLRRKASDKTIFHSLFRDPTDNHSIVCSSVDSFNAIHPNSIADTFGSLYDRELSRSLAQDTSK